MGQAQGPFPCRTMKRKQPVHRVRAEVIREVFLEEVRFQVGLQDCKDEDHWKWVSGEDGKGVKNAHPRKTPAGKRVQEAQGLKQRHRVRLLWKRVCS